MSVQEYFARWEKGLPAESLEEARFREEMEKENERLMEMYL